MKHIEFCASLLPEFLDGLALEANYSTSTRLMNQHSEFAIIVRTSFAPFGLIIAKQVANSFKKWSFIRRLATCESHDPFGALGIRDTELALELVAKLVYHNTAFPDNGTSPF